MALSTDLAGSVARRSPDTGAFDTPFHGGVAVFTGVDSPMTKIIGVGLDGVPEAAAIDALERRFFERGAAARFEVATLADPRLCALLTARGYILEGFENVLGRALSAADAADLPGRGITVSAATDGPQWIEVMIAGFEAPDTGVISAPAEPVNRAALRTIFGDLGSTRGFRHYAAYVGGEIAGAASLRLFEGVAQLCGAATLPAFRRRGVQTAMLRTRLGEAARAGCDLSIVTTQPGSRSQQNVQAAGFAVLYARAVLVRKP